MKQDRTYIRECSHLRSRITLKRKTRLARIAKKRKEEAERVEDDYYREIINGVLKHFKPDMAGGL